LEGGKRDADAPKYLEIIIRDSLGHDWKTIIAPGKEFSTGSVGFYGAEKADNPVSHERYQISVNATLIGSKPKA
jgi:hypothetical protein